MDALATWSTWVDLDAAIATAPTTPGVYMARGEQRHHEDTFASPFAMSPLGAIATGAQDEASTVTMLDMAWQELDQGDGASRTAARPCALGTSWIRRCGRPMRRSARAHASVQS